MNKQLKLGALVAAMLLSGSAFAVKPGYVVDQTTDRVTRNNYNECWHTGFFNKATQGLVECGDREPAVAVPKQVEYVREKVTLSAEVLFDFNKAVLRPTAKSELDPLVNRLKGDANLKSVEVEGYTDRIGSDAYNQKLSQSRAEAVRDYFVNAGVAADKVSAVGKGKADSKTGNQCDSLMKTKMKKSRKASLASPALKACLQPDRRVEINIEGSKVTPK